MLQTTVTELRYKEIISLSTGHRLGFVYDAVLSLPGGQVTALLVPGPARFFGLLGREDDLVIPWEQISKIGEDIILVDMEGEPRRHTGRDSRGKKRGVFF